VNPAAKCKIFQHTYSSLEEHEKVSPAILLGNGLCIIHKSKFLTFKVHWIVHIKILIHAKCDQFVAAMQQISDENKCYQQINIFLRIGKRNFYFYISKMELIYYSVTPLIQINWDSELFRYEENLDNSIFL
jgi:hypothetical protein